MSHFLCLVLGDQPEGQLERYDENKASLVDTTAKYMADYENESTKVNMIQDEHGNRYRRGDQKFWIRLTDEENEAENWALGIPSSFGWSNALNTWVTCNPDEKFARKFVLPPGYSEIELPVKEVFSFKEYMVDYNGYFVTDENYSPDMEESHVVLDDKGQILFVKDYRNPDAKWDWYSVGGRWSDRLMTKNNEIITVDYEYQKNGRKATDRIKPTVDHVFHVMRDGQVRLVKAVDLQKGDVLTGPAGDKTITKVIYACFTDQAFAENIDFCRMLRESAEELEQTWEKAQPIIEPYRNVPFKTLEEINSKQDEAEESGQDSFFKKIREYNSQPIVSALHYAKIYGDPEIFLLPKEEFIERHKYDVLTPYALVENGEWYSKGKMGWWGVSTDERSKSDWQQFVWDKLLNLKDGTLVTVVDCHI